MLLSPPQWSPSLSDGKTLAMNEAEEALKSGRNGARRSATGRRRSMRRRERGSWAAMEPVAQRREDLGLAIYQSGTTVPQWDGKTSQASFGRVVLDASGTTVPQWDGKTARWIWGR